MGTRKPTPVTVQVNVTRNMVDYALQQTSTMCAVALALRDANDDWVLPRVTQDDIRFTDRRTNERVIIKTPQKVSSFIDKFDRQREAVRPFTFELDLTQAERRPVRKLQPSQILKQAGYDATREGPYAHHSKTSPRRQARIPVAIAPTNTSKRELRPVTDG